DGFDKLRARCEGKIGAAPQAEALGIGKVVHRRGARRRDVHDTCVWQRVLQAQAGAALLRRHLIAALGLAAGRVLHGVALVEHDHAVEVGCGLEAGLAAEPGEDLVEAGGLALALGRAQRGVGHKEDAFIEADRGALAETLQRLDQQRLLAKRGPIPSRIADQGGGTRYPDGTTLALEPVVEDDAGDLAALAAAGAVAEEPAAPEPNNA